MLLSIAIICTLPSLSAAESKAALRTLENQFLPYFQYRSQTRKSPRYDTPVSRPPNTMELMKIVRSWSLLSDGFKKVYQQAIDIPANFLMFRSPGYGIEIYFTNNGIDAPDSTDKWYADSSDWHRRIDSPNGIPDYIDEVAWAIDSAWTMEIRRFGFPAPFPYKNDIHSSENYKVIVESLDDNVYGLTYPVEPDSSAGFHSLLSIRNKWNGWDINDIIDYETHPEKGIRITCAHEFFHAIQYRIIEVRFCCRIRIAGS